MRRILILVSLLIVCDGAVADTRKGYDAYTGGDFKTAIEEFRNSAQQGDALAMFYLGESYYNGRGVLQDFAEGIKWYRQSGDKGQVEAQETLGGLYFFGKGIAQDFAEAAKWFRKAAEGGDAQSTYLLGYLYEDGKGVPRDAMQAHMWSNLAASQLAGEEAERVAKVRDFIASKLTPDQLAKAQELARNWQPNKK